MAFPLPAPSKYFIVKTNVLKKGPSQTKYSFLESMRLYLKKTSLLLSFNLQYSEGVIFN